ncbi:MAG: endonuclease domain-containing protein [Candidatus Omnitrophica bacterium]|nr:endonuclease domain-containing protein [Candidatus Omnitrophota bacterium]MCM8806087.1 endonuclease domain-containing protein [Candidatus Omnitrophota bacterium]
MKKYKAGLKHKARRLRKELTETEKYLWKYLRDKQIGGFKFRRQQPVGRYIVDFINFEKKLVIEVDGGQHSIYKKRDIIRDKYLKKEGYRVLRFWDNEVLNNIEGVLEVIMQNLSPSPQPSPLKGEGERNN